MEISELITIIREDYLDDTFSGWENADEADQDDLFLWSNKALLRYLNEAQRQACNRTDFLSKDFTISLKDGVSSYNISNKITFIEEVSLYGKPVIHMSADDLKRKFSTWRTDSSIGDSQAYYTIRARKLRVYSIPDAADAGEKLTITAFHQPLEDITGDIDDLSIPEEYHRDLIWWVLYEAFNKRDAETYNPNKSQEYKDLFDNAFGEYIPSDVRLNELQEDAVLTPIPTNYTGVDATTDNEDW